jgi:hypothetical protein
MSETTTPIAIDVTKAELQIALSKEGLQYQQLLQDGENLKFTKDNLVEQGASLKTLRTVQKKLGDIENPYTANWKAWNEARKSLVDPVADVLKRKEAEYRKLALEIEAEKKQEEQEKERVKGIKQAIDSFFIAQSQAIAGAKTLPELTTIEKIIGSHKANKARYSEFLPELVAKAENLTPLIKQQKDNIRKLEAVKEAESKAAESGDDQAVLDAMEAKEALQNKFDEVNIKAQEQAVGMATKADVVVPEVILPSAPKPRRTTFEWECYDLDLLHKKMPHLVTLTPNKEKLDELLTTKRLEGAFIGTDSIDYFGCKLFIKKSY